VNAVMTTGQSGVFVVSAADERTPAADDVTDDVVNTVNPLSETEKERTVPASVTAVS